MQQIGAAREIGFGASGTEFRLPSVDTYAELLAAVVIGRLWAGLRLAAAAVGRGWLARYWRTDPTLCYGWYTYKKISGAPACMYMGDAGYKR